VHIDLSLGHGMRSYTPHTKTALDWVRKHIESFPVVDGHYTRKDSSRKYLGADLNIMRMYQLYVEQCKGKIPEKEVISHDQTSRQKVLVNLLPFLYLSSFLLWL
jgi:hypothetical protein